MKQFKRYKLMTLCLGVTLIGSTFVGCGNNVATNGKADGPVTLRYAIWDKNQQPVMQKLCDEFTKANPDIKVEIELTPYKGSEYWTKLEAAATGGTAADVFWMNGLHAISYAQGKMILPLDDLISKNNVDMNAFPASLVQLYTVNDKRYGMPKDFDTNAVWYNKEIFDNAGVAYPTDDWTWDDMVQIAKKLTDPAKGIYGVAAPLDSQTTYYNTIFGAGGYVLSPDKATSGFDKPETMAGIQCWIDLINEGVSPTLAQTTDTSADALFESGKLAMCWAGSYMTPEYVANDIIKGKIDLVEAPGLNGKKSNLINGLANCIYANTKYPEQAFKFVSWLGGPDAMKIQGESGVVISARNDATQYFSASNPELNLAAYTNQVDCASVYPCTIDTSKWSQVEMNYLKLAYAGQMTVQEACTKIAEEMNTILAAEKK